jgi:hypothetical protein
MPDLTPADELRAAATALRSEPDLMLFVAGLQLARWLETEAASNAGDEDHSGCTAQTCTLTAALATARAILAGGQP